MLCFSGALADSYEVWESRFLLADVLIELEQSGQDIQGVLFLEEPFRDVATYHFKGIMEGDVVEASHYSGHSFCGRMVGSGEIAGVLTTRGGMRLNITAKRR